MVGFTPLLCLPLQITAATAITKTRSSGRRVPSEGKRGSKKARIKGSEAPPPTTTVKLLMLEGRRDPEVPDVLDS